MSEVKVERRHREAATDSLLGIEFRDEAHLKAAHILVAKALAETERSARESAQREGVERLKPHLVALLGLSPEEAHWPGIVERIEKLMEPRASVRWFAEQMELALRDNDHKGGWHQDRPLALAQRAEEEANELYCALDVEDENGASIEPDSAHVISEAADTANMAMMVADHFREGGPSLNQGHTLPPPPKAEGKP